ncbi:hypothetical protein MTBLM5_10177 [Magnetospirillum sp. LM-5]|nr:hypothetical protein MTBLM5_10177 [Magnetospirillum sp. LM-5]
MSRLVLKPATSTPEPGLRLTIYRDRLQTRFYHGSNAQTDAQRILNHCRRYDQAGVK